MCIRFERVARPKMLTLASRTAFFNLSRRGTVDRDRERKLFFFDTKFEVQLAPSKGKTEEEKFERTK